MDQSACWKRAEATASLPFQTPEPPSASAQFPHSTPWAESSATPTLCEKHPIQIRNHQNLGQKFWNGCGQKMTTPATPERSPLDYTPHHLADKILQSKSALEGERKQLTVMFADVKSSVELSGQVDPEEWHRILDRYFQILTDGVHRFERTVNQYTGDGIMALFGAPVAHEDHARRACYAVLQMRDKLAAYTTELKRSHGLGFSTRTGLHSGEVVVGRIGDA